MDIGSVVKDTFDMYQSFQQANPLVGTVLTAEFTYLAGDSVAQLMNDKKLNPRRLLYTAFLAPIYALSISACMQSGELVGKLISPHPFAKSALGPNLVGNLHNTFFFVNNAVGEESKYSIPELFKHYARAFAPGKGFGKRFKELYINKFWTSQYGWAVAGTLTAWNAIQTANYSVMPEHLRTPTCFVAGFFWGIALNIWALRSGRKLATKDAKPVALAPERILQ